MRLRDGHALLHHLLVPVLSVVEGNVLPEKEGERRERTIKVSVSGIPCKHRC